MSAPPPAGAAAWSPPAEIEEYRIVRPLGRGAMGQVYLAEDRLLDRQVAIKFIAAASPSEAARERFFAEGRAIARLSHPNVVAVHRVGEVGRRPFLVSEYVRGRSLDRIEKPIPWREALALGVGLARGLAAAHRRGVLHRDIKPANAILSDDGEVKLLDFGLAKLLPEMAGGAARRDAQGGAVAGGRGEAEATGAAHRLDPGSDGAGDAPVSLPRPAIQDGDATVSRAPDGVLFAPRAADAAHGALRPESTADAARPDASLRPESTADAARPDASLRPEPPRRGSDDVVGTPLYMAPEVWRGEPASPRADVYALGVLLYELCAGKAPHHDAALAELPQRVQERAPAPLAALAPDVDPRLAAAIERCLERDPARRFGSGDDLREALEGLGAHRAEAAVPEGNPYRGLLAFEAKHRGLFFGRDAEVRAVLDRLRSQPFVLVAGDSGAGKSSLCRAGVLPAVTDGALDEGGAWTTASVRLGARPLAALASALGALVGADERELAERLRAEPGVLGRELRRQRARLLLFLDQLEELCTLADRAEATLATEVLAGLLRWGSDVRLLATARSDFLARLGALPGLGDELPPALYLLRPLSPERLRDAVVGPAAAKGFRWGSDEMVDTLIAEAARAEGGLALLQFTLAELWDARDEARREIPASALRALGGAAGALARHADGVLQALSPEQREAARLLLLALVSPEGTRAQRTDAELLGPEPASSARGAARAALEALVRGRLLVAREAGAGEQSAYEIAHEALLRGWDTLRGWLSGDAERRAILHRIERAAADWERLGRPADALWTERLLREVREVDAEALGAREAAFLTASRRAALRRRLGRWAAVLGAPVLVGAAALAVRLSAARALDRSIAAHVGRAWMSLTEARAGAERTEALRRDALGRFEAPDGEGGEPAWERALSLSAEVDRSYARASQELEVALRLDGERQDVRALLGDALFERAVLAERDRHPTQRDELLDRLATYDDGGERRRRWDAPARLAVLTSPPGAEVALQRFEAADGRRVLSAPQALGRTPLEGVEMARGSLVLTFTATGRAPLRLPLVLERGEQRRVELALPSSRAVPDGFVFVPPGRFHLGMGDTAESRQFCNCQPLHLSETGPFLIARHEVTFADWLAYLRALPQDERERRTPRISEEWHNLELVAGEDGVYTLHLAPSAHRYSAREGEPIRYLGRSLRAVQDWRRFPVSGVSFDDARAYAGWLDRSGRVRGARLCTEREWERAARGADARLFPGGDRLGPEDANHDVTYGRNPLGFGPDEVGSHPASESPFGVHDLAGNVWEWTTAVGPAGGAPILRGGSFYQGSNTSLSPNREPAEPSLRGTLLGVRLCATPSE